MADCELIICVVKDDTDRVGSMASLVAEVAAIEEVDPM